MFSLSDLRSSSKVEELISIEEGQALAGRFRAPFCETSSMTQTGVEECFNTAVSLGTAIKVSSENGQNTSFYLESKL